MRRIWFGLVMVLASAGLVGAAECRGSGSATMLTFPEWELVTGGAKLSYRLETEKPATKVAAQLYFTMAPDVTFADMAIELADRTAVPVVGSVEVALSAAESRALKEAVHWDVVIYACVNTMEFADGSGAIID